MKTWQFSDEDIADVIHGAHGRLNARLGDTVPQGPWDTLGADHKEMITNRVRLVRQGATPEEVQDHWIGYMEERGWTYGPVKDPFLKTHPGMLPWPKLGQYDRLKVMLAFRITYAMTIEVI